MAKPRSGGGGKGQQAPTAGWVGLTWGDLEDWAGHGAVSRGRTYQRGARVKDLAISAGGTLLATVQGGERYATTVSLSGGKGKSLASSCTCPVGFGCKHAIASVAEYLQAVADGRAVKLAAEDDPRWWDLEDAGEGDDVDEDDDEEGRPTRRVRGESPVDGRSARWDGKIERHIREKSQAELADLAWSLTRRYPEIYQEFRERIALQEGDVGRLVAEARREIRRVTSEPAWSNHWNDEGHIPDYSPIRHRFERLLEMGHADEVTSLGREFIEKGLEQIAQGHDEEGEAASRFARCLPVVFQAVMRSSLSPSERILFAIDAELADDSEALGEATAEIHDATWSPEDWSAVADTLLGRLKPVPVGLPAKEADFSSEYRRDQVTGWIADALREAGRVEEVGLLYESEARVTRSFGRLVDHLLEAHRFEDAERWAREGILATVEKYPGISGQLAEKLAEVARKRRRWDEVAAHAAMRFFDRPTPTSFDELMKAAKKAGVEATVREAAVRFLETGVGPFRVAARPPAAPPRRARAAAKKKPPAPVAAPVESPRLEVEPGWPLPVPDYLVPLMSQARSYDPGPRPHLDILLKMAIAAKEPDEVLRRFDQMRKATQRSGSYHPATSLADRVAVAVSASHPERALEIYTFALDAQLLNAQQSAYEAASGSLRKLRPIYEALGRSGEWDALLASIRDKHRNRPRFMEILDRLEGRTILGSAKSNRK